MAEIKNNIVDLEKVIDKLNKTLDENINRLNLGANAVSNFTRSFSNIPSQYLNLLSDLADKNKTLQETQNRLLQVERELLQLRQRANTASSQRNQRTSEEIVNQRTLAQNADRQARATSALVGAYGNLNAQHQIASRRLQDLIARGRTSTQTQSQYNREIREAQRDFQNLDRRIQSADRAVGRFNRNVGNYPRQAMSGLKDLIGAFGIAGGVTLFATIARDIFQTTKELQSLDNALMQVSGTQEQFARSQEFLRDISERFGLEINGLTKQFTQFYVSAKDKLSANEIEGIFTSISKAGSVMGLSVENQERAFLALNQMMSKGVVSAEELRGQLGEALPGAFGIMAKAMNTNEVGLAKLMKDGKLLANEVLPKFAEQLEKVYGIESIDRVETLASAQNRLSNEWTEFIRSLNEGSGVVSNFFKTIISEITETIKWWRKLNEETGTFKENFEKKTEQGFTQQLQAIQKEADQTGISLRNLAITRQQLAVQERNELYEEIKLRQERVKLLLAENPNKVLRGVSGIQDVINSENKKIIELSRSYGYYNGVIKATNYILKNNKTTIDEVKEATDNNTESTKKNTKAKKEAEIYQIGTVKWLNQQISQLKELNDTLSTSSEEYQVGVGAIKFYEQWLERLTGTAKKAKEELDGIALDLGGSEFITDEEGDAIMKAGDELRAMLKEFKKGFIDTFASESGFSGILGIIGGDLKKFEGDAVATALAVSEAFQEAFNTISEASQANFDAEYSRLERQKDFAIEMAGGSASAREEIERQYEERKRAIQKREAEAQKRLAIFNIVTNTAQAILATYAKVGFPAGIPLAIAMGAIGAFQVGLVASQEIPQFWKGTDNAPEGLAWTQEKGAEVITDKNGNVKTLGSDKGAQLTYLSKGDKVYKSHEDYINKVLSKNGISDLGSYMNFAPKMEINNGITKEDLDQNFSKLASVIKNKDGVNISIDERGFRKKQGNTEFINSRLNLTSRQV